KEMKYSRNLHTGNGIELIKYASTSRDIYQSELTSTTSIKTVEYKLYPNPFAESIRIDVSNDQELTLNIYNLQGQLVFSTIMNQSFIWNGTSQSGSKLPKGIYLIRLTEKNSGNLVWTEKVICNKP
ncbi:MAG TPA: T9SS type A sorting domain-containing protein, partial [Prolixibacteraceae bacterium]